MLLQHTGHGTTFVSFSHMATQHLSAQQFKEKIFDYEKGEEWKFEGEHAAIVDFYANWCGPCKAIAPILEELSEEYKGKLDIFKIDTEKETELSQLFGIQSIPTLLFIPLQGAPMMQKGALPKEVFKQVIDEKLLQTS
jgi:thioredoxin